MFGALLFAAGCSPTRQQAQAAPAPPAVEFIGEWGTRGQAPGELDEPAGLAVDTAGRVFIADRSTGLVQKFEVDGTPLLAFEDSSVRSAAGIAVDSGGAIYVADPRQGRIDIFFPEGQLLRQLRAVSQRGFDGPYEFSVDDRGAIYVPDPAASRIQVLSPRGRVIRAWRAGSSGNQPDHPAIVVAGPDGFVYTGDPGSGRIVKFTREGREVAAWGQQAGATVSLLGLAVSPQYVFALRGASPRLEIWTLDGQQVLTDDLGGRLVGAPVSGTTIAWSPGGDLLVLDPSAPRVLRFRIHLAQHP
jgi:streptogramin lyase